MTNATILLLPIGRCHNDHEILDQIEKAGKGQFQLISEYLETLEVAAVISHAKAFLGTSLHGAITAFAYRIPSLTYSSANLTKLEGFLDLIDSNERLCRTMEEIIKKSSQLNIVPNRESYRKATLAIDKHFDKMLVKINIPCSYEADTIQREILGKYLELVCKNDSLTRVIQSERHAKIVETAHLMEVMRTYLFRRELVIGLKYYL